MSKCEVKARAGTYDAAAILAPPSIPHSVIPNKILILLPSKNRFFTSESGVFLSAKPLSIERHETRHSHRQGMPSSHKPPCHDPQFVIPFSQVPRVEVCLGHDALPLDHGQLFGLFAFAR